MTWSTDLGPVVAVATRRAPGRWRSGLVLGALVAVTVALALATLTAARRAETAFDRLREVTHSSDLQVFVDEADLGATLHDLAEVDGIAQVGVSSEMFVRPAGSELFPDFQLLALVSRTDLGGDPLDVPRIVSGRAADPEVVDEIALSEGLADELGIEVGDVIDLESMSEGWIDVAFNGGDPGAPDGPVIAVEVVGLARTPADFGRFAGRVIHLTPAFAAGFEEDVRTYTWTAARLTDSTTQGLDELEQRGLEGIDADEIGLSFFSDSEATQDGLSTIAVALRLVALAGVLAGVTAIGLALARLGREALTVRTSLSAIGWTRAQLVLLVLVLLGPWVLGGIVVGVVLGVLTSPVAALGLARSVDPDVGALAPHPGWVAVVLLVAVLLLSGLLGLAAMRAARPPGGAGALRRPRPTLVRPLPVPLGARRALFGSSERGGRASRAATAAVAASVAVAVAAAVVSASIQRLQDDPSLSGQGDTDQRAIESGESAEVFEQGMAALEGDPRVDDLFGVHVAFGVSGPGTGELTALVLDPRRGEISPPVVSGRMVVQPDEVAVGPATLDELGRSVGEDVELSSERGAARFRIVGTTLFPEGDFQHDSGVLLTAGGADRLLGGVERGTALHQVVFTWAEGVDEAAADRSLVEEGLQPFTTAEGLEPPVVSNLDEVRDLPLLLAVLVTMLGLVTLLHAVVVTTRLRTDESSTLRALGMTRGTVAAVVETQGVAVALVGVAIGIPLGLAMGRQVWSAIADRAHVVELAVAPWDAVALVGGAVLVGAVVLVAPIAVAARRPRPATVLATE